MTPIDEIIALVEVSIWEEGRLISNADTVNYIVIVLDKSVIVGKDAISEEAIANVIPHQFSSQFWNDKIRVGDGRAEGVGREEKYKI